MVLSEFTYRRVYRGRHLQHPLGWVACHGFCTAVERRSFHLGTRRILFKRIYRHLQRKPSAGTDCQCQFRRLLLASIRTKPIQPKDKKSYPASPCRIRYFIRAYLFEDFQFARATSSPVGSLESVSVEQKTAVGWSADPDSPSFPNPVDCYIDSVYAGRVTANLAGAGAPNPPYTGNHRFSFPIPANYQDGVNHQISCRGIDINGGDAYTLLPGSPKTFNIPATIISTTFVELQTGQLTANNNAGGGLRMFPERATPTGPVNNAINVKAKISANRAGVLRFPRTHRPLA